MEAPIEVDLFWHHSQLSVSLFECDFVLIT